MGPLSYQAWPHDHRCPAPLASPNTHHKPPGRAPPSQVLIAWSLAKGFVTLPKSVNPERQRGNLEAARIELSPADIAELDALEEGLVTGWDPIKDAPV